MKFSILKIFLWASIEIGSGTAYAAEITKGYSGKILVVFIDTDVFRRSLESAPTIGEGLEDYSIKIGCMGKADCIARIKPLYALISAKSNPVSSCKTPIYARVTIDPDLTGQAENNAEEREIYDIDHTGKCVNYRGKSYEMKKSVFGILNTKPLKKWGK